MSNYWLQVRDFVGSENGEGLTGYVVLTFLLVVVVVLGAEMLGVSPTAALRGLGSFVTNILAAYV